MKCYNCGLFLPDDSEFCQYCGKKIETEISIPKNAVEEVVVDETTEAAESDLPNLGNSTPENAWNASVKIQTEETVKNLNENKKEKRAKSRFCKFCGGKIDEKTKKCSGCGKQYFKGIKFNKFLTVVLILSLVIISSMILNIVQIEKINELKEDKEYWYNKYVSKSNDYNKKNTELIKKDSELKFYKNNVVIVYDDGSNRYHIHGCSNHTDNSFWVYTDVAAKAKNFRPCQCVPNSLR